MSKLNIDQKAVKTLFSDKKADFLIPDYQRPYAWEEKECQTRSRSVPHAAVLNSLLRSSLSVGV